MLMVVGNLLFISHISLTFFFCGDDPHDEIESFFDKLEYPDTAIEVLTRVTPYQAALLARRTRQHVELGRQTASEEIERELQVRAS